MVTINPNIRTHYIAFYLHKSRSLPFTIDYTVTSIPDVSSLLNLPDHLYSIFTEISTAKHPTLSTLLTLIPTQNLTTDTFPFFYSNPIFVGLLNKNKIDPTIKEFYNQSSTTHASFIKEFFNLKKQTEESGTLQHTLTKFKKYSRVVTRFPPEPSGYLHLGHAKAALLNYYFATQCNGTLRLRFDDTNPLKEEQSYVDCIIEDLKLLGINEYTLSYTSDHFDTLIKYAKELIKRGKAYCDDTDVETMRMERNNAIESKNRNKSIDENLDIFESMLKGENRSCLRAKINMESKNKALCDPVLYRYIEGAHHRTGTKYFIYPTYDFACPIVDSIEDITCALRTNEYRDRNEQYYWVLENLGLRLPDILDFSKLVFENTVLSKRRLKALTESEGIKWNDPRMPTLRGIRRHGMKMDALKNYILLQGMNDKITKISWDKIWAFNKKELEKTSKKYFAIEKKEAKEVVIVNYEELVQSLMKAYKYIEEEGHINYERIRNDTDDEMSEKLDKVSIDKKSKDTQGCEKDQGLEKPACKWSCEFVDDVLAYKMPYNPKNLKMGTKTVYLSKKLYIANENYSDGEEITLMNLGNFIIKENTLEFNPKGDVKKTKIKTQWVSEKNCEFVVNVYGSLFVNDEYNKDSKEVKEYIGEKAIEESQEGCVLQFERDGFYFCDNEGFNLVPFTKQLRKK